MKEEDVGITEYTTPDCKGFVGILKQRFSDFVVREITLDGEVLFLKDIDGKSLQESIFGKEEASPATVLPPEEAVQGTIDEMTKIYPTPISAEDIESLRTFLNGCHSKDAQVMPTWTGLPCDDKAVRGNLHKAIRVHSSDYVESTTEQINDVWHIKLHAKHLLNTSSTSTDPRGGGQNNRNNNNNRQQGGFVKRKNFQAWPADKIGDYLRFTLMKENVDTISAVNNLNKVLHIKANNICYNGTKDKRGITIQHCTIYRKKPLDFLRINRYFGNPFVRIGDFQYVAKPARLGDLAGNRFEIVLRNVQGDETDITKACEALRTVGFINYYGLQRFGKTYAGATHKIGRAVLLSDWQQCIEAMFEAPPADIIAANGGDELADVRRHYQAGKFEMAAMLLPQSMYREREILLRLAKTPSDFAGAFNTMGRNLRLMYVHAYQSALWNRSVSERLKRFGYRVVVGDLVRVRRAATEGSNSNGATAPATVTGTSAPAPDSAEAADDEAAAAGATEEDDVDDGKYAIHRVTEEDVAQGTYSVYDVVLPLLGSESLLPGHEIAMFMLEQLEADGLRSDTFATCHPAYRLKGNYRLMLQLPGNLEYALVRYRHPDEEINATELQQYRNLRPESTNGSSNSNNHKKRDISTATAVAAVDGEQPQPEGEPAAKKARVEDEQPANDNDAGTAVTTSTTTVSAPVAAPSTTTTDAAAPSYLAVTLKFSLQSGCYATMLLREVMKMSTETAHHAMLTSAAVSK